MSDTSRGWTDSAFELAKIQLLDLVEENTQSGMIPNAQEYAGELANDLPLLKSAAQALVGEGLVMEPDGSSLAGELYLTISPAGQVVVQQRRERRANRRRRASACRDALLDWCYDQQYSPPIDQFASDIRSRYEGSPFTREEIYDASRDLHARGFISGDGAFGAGIARPEITAKGKLVVEHHNSDISAYDAGATPVISTTPQTVVTITGSNFDRTQFSVGDNNQLIQRSGADATELRRLIEAVLQAARETDHQDRVTRVLTHLQLETDEEKPDASIIDTSLARLEKVANISKSPVLIAAAAELALHLHQNFSWIWGG